MKALWWILGAVAVAIVAYLALLMIPVSGALQTLDQKLVEQCRRVDVFPGTEDVTIDPEFNIGIVSADDRRAAFAGNPVPGGIYAFNVDQPELIVKISPEGLNDFHPHGLSLWRGPGEKRLFVINHASDGEKVEIFILGPDGMLTHSETIAFPEMHSPNDILAVGPRSFYATNDHKYDGGLMGTLEAYFALPFASVVYFDGTKGGFAAKGLVYANGINQSPDGKTVYVSEFLKRRIDLFDRDPETGALTKRGQYSVNTNPDNIEIAADGGIWVAGHPRVFDFLRHVKKPDHPAPSHVLRVNARTGEGKEFFVDTTGKLNASSVGAVWDKTLIVGSVFDTHVMVCPMVKIFLENAGGEPQ